MTINLQAGGFSALPILPGARGSDIRVGQPSSRFSPEPLKTSGDQANSSTSDTEVRRYEQVLAASQVAADPFPISDRSFTIFKDASGQYVTRYTSLRDGTVTYVPELKLLQQFETRQRQLQAVLTIEA